MAREGEMVENKLSNGEAKGGEEMVIMVINVRGVRSGVR